MVDICNLFCCAESPYVSSVNVFAGAVIYQIKFTLSDESVECFGEVCGDKLIVILSFFPCSILFVTSKIDVSFFYIERRISKTAFHYRPWRISFRDCHFSKRSINIRCAI